MAKAAKKKVYKLKNLLIDRVDLVPKGSNPESHLMLFKAAPGEVEIAKASMTTKEVMAERRRGHLYDQLWNIRHAFNDSIQSILNDPELDESGQDAKLQVATAEFAELARPILAELKEVENAQRFALAKASVDTLSELAKSFNRSAFDEAVESFTKSLPEESLDMATKAPDKKVEKTDDIDVKLEDVQKSLTDVTAERDEFKKELDEVKAELDELKKAATPVDPDDKEAIYKGLSEAQRAHFEKMEADAKEASDIAKAERDARVTSECVAFVKSHAAVSVLSETDDIEMLKFLKAHEGGKYLDRFSQILKSKIEVAKAGGDEIFTEKGHGGDPEPLNVIDKVNQLAKAEQEKDNDLDTHAAVAKVLNSDAVLYEEYRKAQQVSV